MSRKQPFGLIGTLLLVYVVGTGVFFLEWQEYDKAAHLVRQYFDIVSLSRIDAKFKEAKLWTTGRTWDLPGRRNSRGCKQSTDETSLQGDANFIQRNCPTVLRLDFLVNGREMNGEIRLIDAEAVQSIIRIAPGTPMSVGIVSLPSTYPQERRVTIWSVKVDAQTLIDQDRIERFGATLVLNAKERFEAIRLYWGVATALLVSLIFGALLKQRRTWST
jgi:hypothetical protein